MIEKLYLAKATGLSCPVYNLLHPPDLQTTDLFSHIYPVPSFFCTFAPFFRNLLPENK